MAEVAVDCKYYADGGECKHKEAPKPGESACIGKRDCIVYRKDKDA